MNAQRPKFTIQVNGGDGESGYTEYSWRDPQAHKYQDGAHGRSARAAGAGGPGGHLTIQLSPSYLSDGGIHVQGIGNWEGDNWEVPPGQDLLLSAQGGAGGDGGVGEDGQQGGRGRDGDDATRWSPATMGHTGKSGGRGGYGSHGANGGDGGTIAVTVKEEDMNLLSAVSWNVDGGNGGAAGAHGKPGPGGPGGRGGAGYEWTIEIARTRLVENASGHLQAETYYDTEYHSNPQGWNGSSGSSGFPHISRLYHGAAGQNGAISFFVLRNNGAREQYHGCYNLQVSGFNLMDENDDGIYEPGEHVLVKNIQIRNTGVMPSPSLTHIPLSMHSSAWLNGGFPQDGVALPTSIPPGGLCEAQGYMRAFIKQEPSLRLQADQPFIVNETVNVTAIMPGINRPLDNFLVRSPLMIRYPLELLSPTYLRTVSIGDEFTVQWRILNVSRKAYGLNTSPRRLCGTRLHKTGSFDLKPSVASNESFQYAQIIEPGGQAIFNQILCVSDTAKPFSRGSVHLEMLLGEPGDDTSLFSPAPSPVLGARLIAKFDLNIQISPAYKYDPEASFLLLVNTDAPGSLISEIAAFIQRSLRLKVDVYNLSVSGSFVDKKAGDHILTRYAGKTIIILCNSTDYFGQAGRVAYEFIDPWLVSRLLRGKTSILLLGLTNIGHVNDYWAKMVAAPGYAVNPSGDNGLHAQDMDELLVSFQDSIKLTHEPRLELKGHTVTVKKSIFRSFKTSTNRSGKKLAKRLAKKYPFQGYILQADYKEASKTNPAKLVVREGLNSGVMVLASSIPCRQEISQLPTSFEYLIVATLPFENRLQMLWNRILQSGNQDSRMNEDNKEKGDAAPRVEIVQIPEKARRFVVLSIQYDILRETTNFCHKAPFRDPASKHDINILLPQLSRFFGGARTSTIHFNQIPANEKEWLISTMGWLLAEANPRVFGVARARKRMVKDFVKANMVHTPFQGLELELKQRQPQVKKTLKVLKNEMKKAKKAKRKNINGSLVVTKTIAEISQEVGGAETPFHDIGWHVTKSIPTSFWSEEEHAKALDTHLGFTQRMAADEARSDAMLRAMIVGNAVQEQEEQGQAAGVHDGNQYPTMPVET